MRSTLAYMSARILLLVAALAVLYLAGARGLLLLLLAFLISGILSYVLLSGQRDRMSASLAQRLQHRRSSGIRARLSGIRARLEEGARMEDEDDDEAATAERPGGSRPGQPRPR